MPASNKMLKRRELADRVEKGIGDAKGRLPHKEIRVAVMVRLQEHAFASVLVYEIC